jgi:hypothetical protein
MWACLNSVKFLIRKLSGALKIHPVASASPVAEFWSTATLRPPFGDPHEFVVVNARGSLGAQPLIGAGLPSGSVQPHTS